jgi:DNA-binding MurR/RpiR family transcriptional regulator
MTDLLAKIEKEMPEFSKGQRNIAEFIVSHYDKAAYYKASKLGDEVGVSESTIVRFATALGYDGYPELQKAMQDLIRTRLTSNQRIKVTNSLIGDGDLLKKVILSDVEKLKRTLESVSGEQFKRAVEKIVSAKRVFVIGIRSSEHLASFCAYNLKMVFDQISLIKTTGGSEMFEQLLPMSKGDVLIAISFPRYSARIVKAVEYAAENGADVVAITDSKDSPIAASATSLLIAESDMASYADSLVAPLSVINALLVAIGREKQSEISARFDRLERIWDEYGVYTKNKS